MKKTVLMVTICVFFSGCAGGVREETARIMDYLTSGMPRSDEKDGADPPVKPGAHEVPAPSSVRPGPSNAWDFERMIQKLEPPVGLPISCSYIPLQQNIFPFDSMFLDTKKARVMVKNGVDIFRAPEVLEVLTNESEHPLPLEEPESIEDMVVQDVPNFLERMEEDGTGSSPLAELEKEMIHDIPVVINKYVEKYLEYFQDGCRKHFERWLARSYRYLPMMKNLMAEHGLPEDLVYMAMIESGFNPRAYSRAHAVGPWQFIQGTAKRYGLRVDWWVDERRDPEKSTRAAIAYLKDLYDMFGSWYLAAASYNAGERRVSSAVDRGQTSDFWILSRLSGGLKEETRSYIPKLIAAILIAKNPEKYGFTSIEPDEPLKFDRVLVQGSIDLRALARACGATHEELKELNPELKHWITPPGSREYCLKVPKNSGIQFYQNLATMKPLNKVTFGGYVVQPGDTISRIAQRFGSTVPSIMEANRISDPRGLMPGQKLFIPSKAVPINEEFLGATATHMSQLQSNPTAQRSPAKAKNVAPRERMKVHVLQKGETLWDVAQHYSLNIKELLKINNIKNPRSVRPGVRLQIPSKVSVSRGPERSPPMAKQSSGTPEQTRKKEPKKILYTVQKGDNIWTISRRYGVNISEILQWNNLNERAEIYPGDKLRLFVNAEI